MCLRLTEGVLRAQLPLGVRCQLLEQERVPARLGGGLLKLGVQRGEALVFGVEKRVLLCRGRSGEPLRL